MDPFSPFYIKSYFILIPLVTAAGLTLDLIFGDPRWMPHPVKAVGIFSGFLERPLIRLSRKKLSGSIMVLLVITLVFTISFALTFLINIFVSIILSTLLSVFLVYTSIAIKDLRVHAYAVYKSLETGDLVRARSMLARIVGRDTMDLKETEIIRATIESIAENSIDGIFSPLFYSFLLGAPGAVTFKAANTLDSMFGYKDKRYKRFGWASARLDDWLNFIPARLSILIFIITAFFFNRSASSTLRTIFRDRSKHPSPNSAIGESAVAGIMGIMLGGPSSYSGKEVKRPYIGQEKKKIEALDIIRAIDVVYLFSYISIIFFLICYFPVVLCLTRLI